jgi:hypothetical protein
MASEPIPIDHQPDNFPETLKQRDRWLNWVYASHGGKLPVAYWSEGHLYPAEGYQDKTVPFGEAWKYTEWPEGRVQQKTPEGAGLQVGVFYRLPDEKEEDSVVFVDLDDVRDTDTGAFHPEAIRLIEKTDSYAQVSTSGTGAHILLKGEFPNGTTSIEEDLEPTDAFPGPEIEVYTRARNVAMTGDHIQGTADDIERDDDLLAYIEQEHGSPDSVHDVDTQRREPEISKEEIESVDTTTHVQDIYDAVAHIKPGDIRIKSTVTEDRDGSRSLDPSWAQSESGTRLAELEDGWVYRKGMIGLDAAKLVALEERIITDETEYPEGEDWAETIEALRQRGAHIPELDRTELRFSNAAILPEMDGGSRPTNISRSDLQNRTYEAIKSAIIAEENTCVDAIMTAGKSYGSLKATADLGRQVSVFVPRNDMKEQAEEYALEVGYEEDDILVLPSAPDECPTMRGEHGDEWENLTMAQYNAGASPKAIHEMNEGIPCRDGDEEHSCPYEARWQFDPDNYDVLIGHYKHSHVTHVTMGRVAIFDESPSSAFSTTLGGDDLVRAINTFLSETVSPPVDDFTDLLEARGDPDRVQECERWFNQMEANDELDLESPDNRGVIEHVDGRGSPAYHSRAPHAVYSILQASPIAEGSNFERAHLPGKIGGALFFTTSEQRGEFYVEFVESPELHYADTVLALDGTPLIDESRPDPHKPVEWIRALGIPLRHRRILSDAERQDYIQNTLQHRYVSASDFINPYSSGEYNNMAEDASLLAATGEMYGPDDEPPLVFTPLPVERQYKQAGFVEQGLAKEINHPGNLRGTDRYADERLLTILGSTHHGDHEIRRRAAWLREDVSVEGKGADRDYGSPLANGILRQMRENVTAQMAMRVGRDGGGATIVLKTTAHPDYLPVTGKGGVTTWSDGMKQVREAWGELVSDDAAFTEVAEIASHDAVSISDRQVRNALQRFVDLGYIRKGKHPTDGRKNAYSDDGLAAVAEYEQAEIELPELEWPDEWDGDVPEIVRTNIYTSNFRFSPPTVSGSGGRVHSDGVGDPTGANWGDDPAHDAS